MKSKYVYVHTLEVKKKVAMEEEQAVDKEYFFVEENKLSRSNHMNTFSYTDKKIIIMTE